MERRKARAMVVVADAPHSCMTTILQDTKPSLNSNVIRKVVAAAVTTTDMNAAAGDVLVLALVPVHVLVATIVTGAAVVTAGTIAIESLGPTPAW
jgi:hypothetical protein